MKYLTANLTRKSSLIFMLVFTGIIIFDSTIVKFSSYSGVEASVTLNLAIFIIFSAIFAIGCTLLVRTVSKYMWSHQYNLTSQPSVLKYFHIIIISILILSVTTMIMIILQMVVSNNYSLILVRVQTYLSHLAPLIFISFLIFMFGRWLTSKRNYIMLLYVISFSLVSINLAVSLLYLDSYFSILTSSTLIYYPIIADISSTLPPPQIELLSSVFDTLSLSSFLLMWAATALLLRQYRFRIGRIRYFAIISVPLLYYIFPFQNYFGDIFFSLLYSAPVVFSVIYILIFSATKQVGALLFGLSFWSTSSLIHDNRVQKSLLISSIGITILFGSIEIAPLQFTVYPPFGFVTEALIPFGAYLLVVGIFTSAKYASQDVELRKQFYKNASSQLDLLRSIGVAQMEKEYERKVRYVKERLEPLKATYGSQFETEMNEADVKETLHEVLNELYYSKGKKERTEP